jgi:hypothetical protein
MWAKERMDFNVSTEYEDWELESRRQEYEDEKSDRELKIQQEDEVLYGVRKTGSNTDAFLNKYIE